MLRDLDIPQTTDIDISVDLFKRLNQLEHFNYIKDSAGDLITHQEYLATGYMVLNGCDPNNDIAGVMELWSRMIPSLL